MSATAATPSASKPAADPGPVRINRLLERGAVVGAKLSAESAVKLLAAAARLASFQLVKVTARNLILDPGDGLVLDLTRGAFGAAAPAQDALRALAELGRQLLGLQRLAAAHGPLPALLLRAAGAPGEEPLASCEDLAAALDALVPPADDERAAAASLLALQDGWTAAAEEPDRAADDLSDISARLEQELRPTTSPLVEDVEALAAITAPTRPVSGPVLIEGIRTTGRIHTTGPIDAPPQGTASNGRTAPAADSVVARPPTAEVHSAPMEALARRSRWLMLVAASAAGVAVVLGAVLAVKGATKPPAAPAADPSSAKATQAAELAVKAAERMTGAAEQMLAAATAREQSARTLLAAAEERLRAAAQAVPPPSAPGAPAAAAPAAEPAATRVKATARSPRSKPRRAGSAADADVERGDRALRKGQPDEAMAAFQAALKADPKAAGAVRGLAMIQMMRGNEKEARREYQRYLALAPDAPDAARIRRVIANLGTGGAP